MTFKKLLASWAEAGRPAKTAESYAVHLSLDDAARVHALADMFPGRSREEIITDLISVALQEVQAAMPYVRGERVISTDEQGDPLYEDAGPTPRFIELARMYRRELAG